MNDIEKAIEVLKRDIMHHEGIVARNLESPEYCKGERQCIDCINIAISALQQQLTNGWIPVSERLPEINKDVQVTFREFMDYNKKYRHGICKAIYIAEHSIKSEDMGWDGDGYEGAEEYDEAEDVYYVKNGWCEVIEHWPDYTHVYINCEVTAWQPLPESYKETAYER